jgi:hypothetical protein
MCEVPFAAADIGDLLPAVAMRSAGQVLALRLLDRELWGCDAVRKSVVRRLYGVFLAQL